jgi:hypothetical protein
MPGLTYRDLAPVGSTYVVTFTCEAFAGEEYTLPARVAPRQVSCGRRFFPGLSFEDNETTDAVKTAVPWEVLEVCLNGFHEGDEDKGGADDDNNCRWTWRISAEPLVRATAEEAAAVEAAAAAVNPDPDAREIAVGGATVRVTIADESDRGDYKRRGGNPSIIVARNGAEILRGTWDEIRDLVAALTAVTDIAEHG